MDSLETLQRGTAAALAAVKDLSSLTDKLKSKPLPASMLAPDHEGMRVDVSGLTHQAVAICKRNNAGIAFMLEELERNLTEMGTRFYAGDVSAVDEFLQLYCIGKAGRESVKKEAENA